MILDAQNQFSSAQALTATADSTNVIDLGVAREIGVGEPMCVLINLTVAADDGNGDETYVVELETDDNAAMSSSVILGSATILMGIFAASVVDFTMQAADALLHPANYINSVMSE